MRGKLAGISSEMSAIGRGIGRGDSRPGNPSGEGVLELEEGAWGMLVRKPPGTGETLDVGS